ncbi:MAG: 6-carboxytetrahydropterin synthase QueD [Bacteroidetes bacterium]|nr:6-carboxytetrahydropterin synthase QueD [Bacteroidota bacterium]
MMVEIYKEFSIDSAHFLPHVPKGHKCRHMHGHTYHIRLMAMGPIDPLTGMVMDFADIKEVFQPIKDQLDHKVLNDIPGLENPSCEVLCVWLWNRLKPLLPLLSAVEVRETPTSGCVYRPLG